TIQRKEESMKRKRLIKKLGVGVVLGLMSLGFWGSAFSQSVDEAVRVYNQGQEAYKYGRYEEALGYYERSLKICRALNHLQGISANLNEIGFVYNSLGQYEKALSYYEESLKIYKELNIPQDIAISLNNIGGVYYSLGQYEKALSYYEESLKIYKELNIPQDIAISLNNAESTKARVLLEAIAESAKGYLKSELPLEMKKK
ncbi:MAG: tetratricopeptide repeat protein, partial [bacterium]